MKCRRVISAATLLGAFLAAVSGCDRSLPLGQPLPGGEEIGLPCPLQGIEGVVLFWEGDFMPPGPGGSITPVERELFVHAPTRHSDVTQEGDGPFFSEIRSNLVARAWSDVAGRFRILLPPGTYSLFVREGNLFYANSFTNEYIFPVTVERRRMTSVTFDITYLATF